MKTDCLVPCPKHEWHRLCHGDPWKHTCQLRPCMVKPKPIALPKCDHELAILSFVEHGLPVGVISALPVACPPKTSIGLEYLRRAIENNQTIIIGSEMGFPDEQRD